MAGSATLSLTREGIGIELRRGPFEIAVDGTSVGTITWQQTVELPLAPGQYSLRLQAGRYASRTQSFAVAADDVVTFRCHGAMVWPRFVAARIKPDLGIALRRD